MRSVLRVPGAPLARLPLRTLPSCGLRFASTVRSAGSAYAELASKLGDITQLQRCQSVLMYDQLVFMPQSNGASKERGYQLAALAGTIHEKSTDAKIFQLIETAEKDIQGAGEREFTEERRVLEIEKKAYLQNSRVPSALAREAASLSASAHQAWVEARQNNNFASFEPTLQTCFDTARAIGAAKRGDEGGEQASGSVYETLLDEFEPGMQKQRMDQVFGKVKEALVPLIQKVQQASSRQPSLRPLQGAFPIDQQKQLCDQLVKAVGFSEETGRFDESAHPFTSSSSPSDVRITTRYKQGEWHEALNGAIHEAGHALYEMHLPPTPLSVNSFLSMGTHESQSLFWERHVLKSRPFWEFAEPFLRAAFPDFSAKPEEVYRAVNAVSAGLIRVEADELTYPLHIILRYQLETSLIEGTLDVAQLPEEWNTGMRALLGVEVPSDAEGCLQDVHWSSLAVGYFPTYLIGSIAAAQLHHYCRLDLPHLDGLVAKGDFGPVRKWLTDKVHRHGKRHRSLDALLLDQLGEELNPKYFIEYCTTKYSDLYRL